MDAAARRVPVFAHIGVITTRETIALVCHARGCGAQAASVTTSSSFRAPDEALIAHACRVAEAAPDLPIFLYNIPQDTGNTLSLPVVESIAVRCPNVVGLEDRTDDLDARVRFTMAFGVRLQALCDALQAGPGGSVSGAANLFPEIVVGLFAAFARGGLDGVRSPGRWSSPVAVQTPARTARSPAAARCARRRRRPPTRRWSRRSLACGHIIYGHKCLNWLPLRSLARA